MYISGIENFDKAQYLGTWYEYANVFEWFQIGARCVKVMMMMMMMMCEGDLH